MSGVLLGSALEEALKRLPKSLKPQQLTGELKRAGVKDEELELSGLGVLLPEELAKRQSDAKGRVATEGLSNLPRLDEFSTNLRTYEGDDVQYETIVPGHVKGNQGVLNYGERIYSFSHPEQVVRASGHFRGENSYLMHTRMWDELIGGKDTRVIGEIQSDLHQNKLNASKTVLSPDYIKNRLIRLANESENGLDEDAVANAIQTMMKETKELYTDTDHLVIPSIDEIKAVVTNSENLDSMVNEFSKQFSIPKKAAAWETSWARKGLENEIKQALAEGKQQIAIPIRDAKENFVNFNLDRALVQQLADEADVLSYRDLGLLAERLFPNIPTDLLDTNLDYIFDGPDRFITAIQTNMGGFRSSEGALESMVRASGVQKWYETNIDPTAQKLAKQMGADTRVVVENGIEYRVIDLTKPGLSEAADSKFKLYAGGGALAYYMALQEGYGEDEVVQYMREQGFSDAEIEQAKGQQQQVSAAIAEGYTPEEINGFLEPKQSEETIVEPTPLPAEEPFKQEATAKLTSGEAIPADELLASLQVIAPNMSSVSTRIAAFAGYDPAVKAADEAELATIQHITRLGAERGLTLEFEEGKWIAQTEDGPVDVTPGFLQSLAAESGEIIGSVGGGIYGAYKGFQLGGANPWAKAGGALVGGIAGAVTGGVAGTQLDYLYHSMKLHEDMHGHIAAHKALTAAEAAAYGEVVGLGLVKFGGTLWNGALRAKNFILDGNSEGARKALKDTFFLSQEEIDEIVAKFSSTVDTSGLNQAQKEITAVALTQPGAEMLVRAASTIDPQASRAVVNQINDRATQLLGASKEGTTETGRLLKQDLDAYVSDVKNFYNSVKMRVAENNRNKYYKFNLDNVAIKPVLESLTEKISDPAIRERFILQLNQAKRHTDNRTFSDLIELRQLVNEFRFNKRVAKADDYKALDKIITSIDERIERGAKWMFGKDAQTWLDDFATARAKYSEMKTVQNQTLYKMINRQGITPQQISQALLKYSDSIDGSYETVMSVVPKQMRQLAERDMVNTLAEKYTAGAEGGMRAVNFPMLAKDLSTRSFMDPETRQLVKAIEDMASVFQNDVKLAQSSGMMRVPEFQSYLTTDPIVRAKFEVASTIFNGIKQRIPGSKASREIALIKNTAKFLEKPLNAKAVKELKEEAAGVVGLDDMILNVQRAQGEAIASRMDPYGEQIELYGSGKILSTEGSGAASTKIPAHRVASPEVVRGLAIQEGLSVDSKLIDDALKRYGFKAVQYGSNKVRLLD